MWKNFRGLKRCLIFKWEVKRFQETVPLKVSETELFGQFQLADRVQPEVVLLQQELSYKE